MVHLLHVAVVSSVTMISGAFCVHPLPEKVQLGTDLHSYALSDMMLYEVSIWLVITQQQPLLHGMPREFWYPL